LPHYAKRDTYPSMNDFTINALLPQIKTWLEEDDLVRNVHYLRGLPDHPVKLLLKIKSPLVLAGADFFTSSFVALGESSSKFEFLRNWDGKSFVPGEVVEFPEPVSFNVALTAERLALNLLQHASSIATWTSAHVKKANSKKIKILDTRKTTPGLRGLEKYAVRVGGGSNHRLGQTDSWMIKDNHKACLGGLTGALDFFKSQGAFYNNIICEIHSLDELQEAKDLGINHLMLDNFSPAQIKQAITMKKDGMTYEISGGIKLQTIDDFLIEGVDAISLGSLVYSAPRVDISLKFKPYERL
jgi:nicotinate-nucleotide pyrophosphorylase (carboxylating)